jgi:hypothetical protein
MPVLTHTAHFSDGASIKRNSSRYYQYAWRCTDGSRSEFGFASSKELAGRAAKSAAKEWPKATYEIVHTILSHKRNADPR